MFAYEYRYDKRGRMEMKILPLDGAKGATTQYWYDKADHMAYMKDAALGNRYRFYLYDKLGRLCVQGTCNGGSQGESILSTTSYISGSEGICKTGYSAPYTISDPQLEIVNYYDRYEFIGKNLTSAMPSVTINSNDFAIGYLTGSVVYATNGEALGSINVYDQKGQVVRSVRKGLNGYLEDVSTGYTFTGDIDNTVADINVKYGSHLNATTNYTYSYGKKTKMKLSISHGRTALARETEYAYDAIGRLISKRRQLTSSNKSNCTYSYDVHGWLTSLNSGGFQEYLYYTDGLDGGCYNGNISTLKWKASNDNSFQGYNLKYDDNNRLNNGIYGTGDNLSINNCFSEYVEYDCNGNITKLQRRGLTDSMHGGFGLVDNLFMTYEGNLLTSVRDDATRHSYAGATDFDGVTGREYPLTYNDAGSLVSDAGRKIARIDYDHLNNPVRIQFTNGNVTKYVYSATGEKLRVTHQTAVPNIIVAIGCSKELAPSEIQCTDYTDYLLGGTLTLKNGRIDKYHFDEGYCQAEKYIYNTSQDDFTFCYYDQDHLGNIRQVTEADGSSKGEVIQTMRYYPFGAQFCDGTADSNVQSRRYNGKEFDKMHGLNTYDYGARQYNPVTARWDRVDPLCEKNPAVTPYHYCNNNPMNFIDPDGMWPWNKKNLIEYRGNGTFGLNVSNLSATTRRNIRNANNNPSNWKPGEVGINTEIGHISLSNYSSDLYTLNHKVPGIDPKDESINVVNPTAKSTGSEDRRFSKHTISSISGKTAAKGVLALDLTVCIVDTYQTWSSFFDSISLDSQKEELEKSINRVSNNFDLIPEEYRNNVDVIGAIINYVFQGVNSSGNKDIEEIGKQIINRQ